MSPNRLSGAPNPSLGRGAPRWGQLAIVDSGGTPPRCPSSNAGDAHWGQRTTDHRFGGGYQGEGTGANQMPARIETKRADRRNSEHNHDTLQHDGCPPAISSQERLAVHLRPETHPASASARPAAA